MSNIPAQPRVNEGYQQSPMRIFRGLKSRWHYPDQRLVPGHINDGYNVNFGEQGFASRRKGYAPLNTSAITTESITGFHQANIGANGRQQVIVTPTKIYTDNLDDTRKDITGSVTKGGDEDAHNRFALIQNKLISTNGSEMWTWDGDFTTPSSAADFAFTTGDGLTTFTDCEQFVVHNNVLVALAPTEGGTKQRTRIRWSDVDTRVFDSDITVWRDDNRFEVGDQGGSPIVGGVENWDKLWIFKEDGAYYGSIVYSQGYIEYRPEGVLRGFSPISASSFIARPEFICGVAREGIFVIDQNLNFRIVTLDIQDIWNGLKRDRLQYSVAMIREKDHQVRVSVSSATNTAGHDRVISWDWETDDIAIMRYTDRHNHIASYYDALENEYDFLGLYDNTEYMRGNIGSTDNGSSYNYDFITVPDDLGSPGTNKTIANIILYYTGVSGEQSITMTVHRNQGLLQSKSIPKTIGTSLTYNNGSLYNRGLLYGGGANQKALFEVNRTADNIQIQLQGSAVVDIVGYQVEYYEDDMNGEFF